ncbi:MAG: lipid II flippase MurJ, partial [Culicoidibacterales bacterium]
MKNAAYVMIFNLIAQLLGFLLNILMAQNIGVSLEMDTFRLAQSYSFAVSVPVFAAIQVTFIPMYINLFSKHGEVKADKLYHQISKILILLLSGIGLLFLGFTYVSGQFLWPDSEQARQLFVFLSAILYVGQICYTYSVLSMAFLQAKEKFFVQSLSVILTNLVPILYFLLFYGKATNVVTVMTMLTTGYALQFILIRVYSRKFVTKTNHYSDLQVNKIVKDAKVKEFIVMAIPVLISNVILKLSDLTEQSAAVLVGVGQLSILSFSYLLYTAILSLSVTPFITVIYPKLTTFVSDKNQLEKKHYYNIILVILTILIPIMMGFMLFGQNILEVLLSPRYTNSEIQMTYLLTSLYLVSIIFYGIREVTYRVCYTGGYQSVVMKNTLFASIIRIIGILVLGLLFKLPGIVMALAISIVVSLVRLQKFTKKIIIGSINKKNVFQMIVELVSINAVATIGSISVLIMTQGTTLNTFIATIFAGFIFV